MGSVAIPDTLSLSLPPRSDPYSSASARTSTTRVAIMEEEEQSQQQQEQPETETEQQQVPPPPHDQTFLSFLLVSGRRRTMGFDPETTVGRVKELVWNAWPAEAEWQQERPPAPAYLRILYLGKILQDEDTLSKLGFPSQTQQQQQQPPPPPTIVHLSVRSHAPPAEDAAKPKKRKSIRRGGTDPGATSTAGEGVDGEDGAGCCCIVC
ncbi:hypothetical protein FB45DRAFT_902525 [Roridomyces roridus]|uniref:Ubiquitin-like domain-containing protein n=1 Tax=Roridomyces roridus TaxID=1738132 RepID=A0AAD7FTF5_9AGAR|nr:hypothetical protein FB45DRAFT_902525 [Roridomyces roridus]